MPKSAAKRVLDARMPSNAAATAATKNNAKKQGSNGVYRCSFFAYGQIANGFFRCITLKICYNKKYFEFFVKYQK